MLADDEILEQASKNIREFQEYSRTVWLDPMREAYAVREGLQWLRDQYDKVINDGLTPRTLNLTAPILNAVIGFQVQNRSEVSYIPRMIGDNAEEARRFADMAENGVNWIEDVSQAQFHDSAAFADMVTCGVGGTDTSVDYNHNEFGQPLKGRVFPGFLMWDSAAHQKNLLDANWVGQAKVVAQETLAAEAEEADGHDGEPGASFDDSYFLDWFNPVTNTGLAVVYEYQWRQKEPVYLLPNPFINHTRDSLVMNWLAEATARYGFEAGDAYISLGKKDRAGFNKEIAALNDLDAGIELQKPIRKQVWRYYRATIWDGKVQKKALNFSQSGFSLKFMTGNYSETNRCFYGMVWDLKDPQRLLNQAVTDIDGYYRSIPKGGVNIESDAVDDIAGFIATYGKARDVTIFKPGALSGNKVLPKSASSFPPGLFDAAKIYADMMMRVAGVTPEFMGAINTKDMSGVLHAQLVQQGLTVLSPYFDAMKFYVHSNGPMYIDLLRILAQNLPERPIRKVTGQGKAQYMALLEDNIAAEYDIEIEDVPLSPTQRQETFEKLMESGMAFLQANPTLGSAMVAESLQYSPLQQDQIERIRQAATPLPPPENPLQKQLVEAETRAKIAEANQKEADAYKKTVEAASIVKNELHGAPPESSAPEAPSIDPIAMAESAHKTKQEREKGELDVLRHAEEDARKDREEDRKDRELELKEEEQRIRRDELDAKRRDAEESRKAEREKLRMANPTAAEALDMIEEKKKAAEKEADARVEAIKSEGEARTSAIKAEAESIRKATTDMVGKLTETIGKVMQNQAADSDKAAKAVAGMGKEVAKAVTGMAKAVDRITVVQQQTANKMDAGLAELAGAVAAMSQPRERTVVIQRSDGTKVQATMTEGG